MPDVTIKYAPFASIHYKRFGFSHIEIGYRIMVEEIAHKTVYLIKGLQRTRKAEANFDAWVEYMDVVDTAVTH